MYCERCRILFGGEVCPECRRRGREPRPDDFALAAELTGVFPEMYRDVLRQEGIPSVTRGELGAGLSAIVGAQADVTRFYVPYARLTEAKDLADGLFGSPGEEETFEFRPMRRFRQQLPEEECRRVLRECPRGALAVLGDGGYPYALPIDFWYDEARGTICFHGAKEGHKLDAMRRCDKASFCVWDEGFRREGEWALNIRSVIVFGRLRVMEDRARTLETARQIGLKYHPTAESAERELEKAADRVLCWELIPEHMTGKLVNES